MLGNRTEVILEAAAAQRAIESELQSTLTNSSLTKNSTNQMTAEMTQQFKLMQGTLVEKVRGLGEWRGRGYLSLVLYEGRINSGIMFSLISVWQIALLSRTVGDLKEQLASEEERQITVRQQKDDEIAEKDAEVFALKVNDTPAPLHTFARELKVAYCVDSFV
jgi:hypothetical protein